MTEDTNAELPISMEEASERLGVSELRLRQLVEGGYVSGMTEDGEVYLPSRAVEIYEKFPNSLEDAIRDMRGLKRERDLDAEIESDGNIVWRIMALFALGMVVLWALIYFLVP